DQVSYQESFAPLGVHPHLAAIDELRAAAAAHLGSGLPDLADDRDGWLDLLLSHAVQPELGIGRPCILYDYPASQAALARTRAMGTPQGGTYQVAERFELIYRGIELANGYHELLDPAVLRRRIGEENTRRVADGK